MPIQVVCPGCKSRFTVSDQFAGRTGPCPKCKQSITIPAPAAKAVTIHEPEAPAASSQGSGRVPLAPITSTERPVSTLQFVVVAVGAVASLIFAVLARVAWQPGQAPQWALAAAAVLLAFPCAAIGYRITRNRELEPYTGRPLLVRALACAAVYAALWAVRGAIPLLNPDWPLTDMYEWFIIGPLFIGAGTLAALATLDLEAGNAAAHFSFYVLFTSLLRWLAGLSPL
jgi:hypothetical protein